MQAEMYESLDYQISEKLILKLYIESMVIYTWRSRESSRFTSLNGHLYCWIRGEEKDEKKWYKDTSLDCTLIRFLSLSFLISLFCPRNESADGLSRKCSLRESVLAFIGEKIFLSSRWLHLNSPYTFKESTHIPMPRRQDAANSFHCSYDNAFCFMVEFLLDIFNHWFCV